MSVLGKAAKAASTIARAAKSAKDPKNSNNKTAQGLNSLGRVVKNQFSSGGGGGSSSPAQNQSPAYNNVPQINFDDYRTQLLTVEDIAKKYGFDYSRDYAKSQAELIKRQQKEGLEETRNRVDNDLYSAVEDLDRNYFQRYQDMLQNQAVTGVTGALAADQFLRANMGRQAAASDLYRDNAAANYEIQNALGRLDAEATVYEDQLFNERLQQAFQNIISEGGFRQNENLTMLQAAIQQRGQDIGQAQYASDLGFRERQASQDQDRWLREFERVLGRDDVADNQWRESFDWQRAMDEAGLTGMFNNSPTWQRILQESQLTGMYNDNPTWQRILDEAALTGRFNGNPTMSREQMEWERLMSEAGLTGYYNGSPTLPREQFESDTAWREYTFNNMSAAEKANFEWLRENLGAEMAWRYYESRQQMAMEEAALQAQLGFTNGGGGGDTSGYYQQYKITSQFGNRKDPITGKTAFHSGIDIAMPKGASVKATVPGEVVYAGFGQKGSGYGGFGNVVVVKDAQGRLHQYSHLDSIGVKKGQKVGAGAYLGGAGSTGRSTGNHLEYMVKDTNGKAINPIGFLSGTPAVTNEATTRKATNLGNSSYKNMYKTQKEASKSKTFQTYTQHLNKAIQSGKVPASWGPALTELIGRESSWNPSAKNNNSSAHGYGQFLSQTRQNYEKKTGLSYSDPVNQIIMTAQYIKDRYGTPENALRHWDKKKWY